MTKLAYHPLNLFLRFILELTSLFSIGLWGYHQSEGWISITLAILIPLVLMIIWGVFAVPNDASRSGKAPIPTPGILRLIIEIIIFGFGIWSIIQLDYYLIGFIYLGLVVLHHAFSFDRIKWLISNK